MQRPIKSSQHTPLLVSRPLQARRDVSLITPTHPMTRRKPQAMPSTRAHPSLASCSRAKPSPPKQSHAQADHSLGPLTALTAPLGLSSAQPLIAPGPPSSQPLPAPLTAHWPNSSDPRPRCAAPWHFLLTAPGPSPSQSLGGVLATRPLTAPWPSSPAAPWSGSWAAQWAAPARGSTPPGSAPRSRG